MSDDMTLWDWYSLVFAFAPIDAQMSEIEFLKLCDEIEGMTLMLDEARSWGRL